MIRLPGRGALGLISLVALVVTASLPGAVAAQTNRGLVPRQWRDVLYQTPSSEWQPVLDTDPKWSGRRLMFGRREALHDFQLIVTPVEAPVALAPSEVATKYFETRKQDSRTDGSFSGFKTEPRTIGGAAFPTFSVRFTPTAGPPIIDAAEVLVFPADYDQRQRWLTVQWADTHSGTTGARPLDELDTFVGSLRLVPIGSVLLTDDFSNPRTGPLSDNATSQHFDVSYAEGQFAIQMSAQISTASTPRASRARMLTPPSPSIRT